MARARLLKPGFFTNGELTLIPPFGRLLFAGLWTLADREGRMKDRPREIRAAVFPYDELDDSDVDELLDELATRGFIVRYAVDGERYLEVCSFTRHQKPHANEVASVIPGPSGERSGANEGRVHKTNGSSAREKVVRASTIGTSPLESASTIGSSASSKGGSARAVTESGNSDPEAVAVAVGAPSGEVAADAAVLCVHRERDCVFCSETRQSWHVLAGARRDAFLTWQQHLPATVRDDPGTLAELVQHCQEHEAADIIAAVQECMRRDVKAGKKFEQTYPGNVMAYVDAIEERRRVESWGVEPKPRNGLHAVAISSDEDEDRVNASRWEREKASAEYLARRNARTDELMAQGMTELEALLKASLEVVT